MRAYKKADKLEKKSDKANIDALWQNRKQSIRRLLRSPFPGGGRSRKSKNSMQLQRQEKSGQEVRLPGAKEHRERARLRKSRKYRRKDDGFYKEPSERNHLHSDICGPDYDSGRRIVLLLRLFQGGGGAVIGSSFTAEDEDIIGANDDYKALETALRNRINGNRGRISGI